MRRNKQIKLGCFRQKVSRETAQKSGPKVNFLIYRGLQMQI